MIESFGEYLGGSSGLAFWYITETALLVAILAGVIWGIRRRG